MLGGEYPKTWKDFIGQDMAKEQLLIAARSAKRRGQPMQHCLLKSGIPGIGKTSLALLAAAEMDAGCHIISGKVNIHAARMAFAGMKDGDVLIYDEIHKAVDGGKAAAEWLLHYMQDGVLLTPLGPEKQPKVTIIGATTDAGRLPETLLTRFKLQPVLVAYTEDEAARIAQGMARRILGEENLPLPSLDNCLHVARAASASPRVMQAIWESVRDIALVNDLANYSGQRYDLSKSLQWLGLTQDGLTETAVRYLLVLLFDFAGQPAGMAAMQDRLQEPGGLAHTERLLMDKGLLAKGVQGRTLTSDGIRRAQELARTID